MFEAYPPQQPRIGYCRLLLPLIIAGFTCLVLYSYFESTEEVTRTSNDVKRLQPFLSSGSFEIGFWTRQKGSDDEADRQELAARPTQNPELQKLLEQLTQERSRTASQQQELQSLRGAVDVARASAEAALVKAEKAREATQVVVVGNDVTTPPPAQLQNIPGSLWREAPQSAAIEDAPDRMPSDTASMYDTPSAASAEKAKSAESSGGGFQDHTITVKTGGKEIILQFSQESEDGAADVASATTAAPVTSLPFDAGTWTDAPQASDVQVSKDPPSQADAAPRGNASSPPRQEDHSEDAAGSTQITVRSGQQSITIQVREGENAEAEPEAKVTSTPMASNSTVAASTASPSASAVRVLPPPELPDFFASEVSEKDAVAGLEDKVPENADQPGVSPSYEAQATKTAPDAPSAGSHKSSDSSFANLALRAR